MKIFAIFSLKQVLVISLELEWPHCEWRWCLRIYIFGAIWLWAIFPWWNLFHAISSIGLSELGSRAPPPSFFCSEPYLSQEGRLCPPHFEIRAFRIFRPSYGSASCFRSKFFLPSCPRLGDIEKDKYTWRWGFLTSFLPFRVSGSFLKPLLLF